ncbi:MAG: TIGR00730 family Rossman fold protein [Acidimicrobiia bacterium]
MKPYQLGHPGLDEQIRQLVIEAGDGSNQDLIAELLTTVLKLHRDRAERGDLKMVNTALKEMRYSLAVFARHHEPKVTIFGSARLPPSDPNFQLAEGFAGLMADKGWGVITGAGPGIMAAGSKGAGLEHSYGVNIRLPFELDPVGYIAPQRNINFKYFFTRKLTFIKESHAFALFPGGFGTLDETFELLTLVQTGKSDMHPIVLIEAPGTGYWPPLLEFFSNTLVEKGLISPADTSLFEVTGDAHDAAEHILNFYSNFHSQRYVEGKLVLRMKEAPEGELLAQINDEFADIVATGEIERTEPSAAEEKDADALDQERLVFNFDRRSYGRLRLLLDRLNTLVSTPERVAPPAPFQEEQAERPW